VQRKHTSSEIAQLAYSGIILSNHSTNSLNNVHKMLNAQK